MLYSRSWFALVAVAALGLAGGSVFAQGGRGGGGGGGAPGIGAGGGAGMGIQQRDATRTFDRDRLQDRDTLRQRDRDRLLLQQSDRIYGSPLMSAQERTAYQHQLHSMTNEQERVRFRLDHQREMQARARQQGTALASPPSRAQIAQQEQARQRERSQVYGYSLMSPAEVDQYRERIRVASGEQQRAQIRSEHQKEMQERAREQGVTLK